MPTGPWLCASMQENVAWRCRMHRPPGNMFCYHIQQSFVPVLSAVMQIRSWMPGCVAGRHIGANGKAV